MSVNLCYVCIQPHLLHLNPLIYKASRLDSNQEAATSSCKEQRSAHASSAASRDHLRGDPKSLWSVHSMRFFEKKLNLWGQSACLQKGSLSCLILQDNSYREQLETTCNVFSVFFVSFSLSEMPGAQLFLAQACGAALNGRRTCPSPRGHVGVHFLHEEHVQQKTEDFSYSHANLLSSEGHTFQIKYPYLCFSSWQKVISFLFSTSWQL